MSTWQRLCLAVRLGNWRQSPLLTTKCQKISKSLQLWMRCIFSFDSLFVVTKNPSQSPLLTIYDKKIPATRKIFWGLSSTVSPFFPSPCSVQLMVVVIAVAKFGLLQKMWAFLIKHEEGWALPYLCCWTEYAGFQGLEQAARVCNFTMLKASSTGCLWRMAILGSLNEWYNKIFSKTLVLVLKILNSVCETKWIRVKKLDLLL